MTTALYLFLAALVLAAAIGIIPLRRYQDRQWAEHLARQRFRTTPQFVKLAKDFEQFGRTLSEAPMPSMQRAAQALSEMMPALQEVYRAQPWWRRVAWRLRARWSR